MDFELSDDQLALRAAARDLLDGLAGREAVRAVVDGGGFDRGLWKAMVDQGWTGVLLGEAEGGLGLGAVEWAVLLEEVGAHVAPAPFLQTTLALQALESAASAGVAEAGEWVGPMLAGDVLGTVAATAVEVDERGRLSGRPEPVLFAPSADVVVLPAGDDLYAVDLREARPAAQPAMDRTRELAWLDLQDAPALRLGGPDAVTALVDHGTTGHAAELLGASARMLEVSVQYAKDRVQFGKPIGSFQAVKHRCADMLVDVEGMRSAVYYAAWCLSAGNVDTSLAASTAKTWCSDAGLRVMGSALQVHGGVGFTWEADVHLYLKRAQLDAVSFGDATVHRSRLAALLRPRVEAGEGVL